jgi:RNA polymerase-binding protein DksA
MLSRPDLDDLQRRLAERARDLRRALAAARPHATDLDREVSDRKDEADRIQGTALDYAESERELAELAAIAQAQDRIVAGRYGRCIDCTTEIDVGRLLAQPAAARCIDCQRAAEARRPRH